MSSSNMRMRFYAEGVADLLNATPDQLRTATILGQAIPVRDADKQVAQFIDYVKALGWIGVEYDFQKESFELSLRWKQK